MGEEEGRFLLSQVREGMSEVAHEVQIGIGMVHRHYKGGRYIPVGIVRNSEKREQQLVVYVSLDHASFWARPLETPGEDSWRDRLEWPDGEHRARFVPEILLSDVTLYRLGQCWAEMASKAEEEAKRLEAERRLRPGDPTRQGEG
jgi:hypothetical protein